jgi:predicted transcriptional regulator
MSRGGATLTPQDKTNQNFLRKKEVFTMENKITYKELYTALLEIDEVKANSVWVKKLNEALENLEKKSANKSASKTQIENEEIKADILEIMVEGTNYTCTQIMKSLNDERIPSQQKCSALMNALAKEGKVTRIVDKKATYFSKVA